MVDVNTNTDVKGFGMPAAPATAVEDRTRPRVAPVRESSEGNSTALDDKALHGDGRSARQRLDREQVSRMAEEIQSRLDSLGGNLKIALNQDKGSDSIVVQISERNTGEVIRQVPPEEVLDLKKKLEDLVGLLFDQKA